MTSKLGLHDRVILGQRYPILDLLRVMTRKLLGESSCFDIFYVTDKRKVFAIFFFF